MSVRWRKNRSSYQISFTYKFPDGSKRRVRETSQHTNKRDVEDEERAIRQALKDGTYDVRAGEDTLDQFSARFFREAMVNNKASTKAGYSTVYNKHLKRAFGSKKLSDVTKNAVDTFKADLVGDEELEPNTINNILRLLHRMLMVAKDWGLLKGAVPKMGLLSLGVKTSITIDDHLLAEEAYEFVRTARDDMFCVMALVAVRTGLRLGELRALRWSEVDFERAQVNVVRTLSLDEITEPKGKRRRDVPLPPDALLALKHWHDLASERELVFADHDNRFLDHKDCEDEFKEMWFLAGLRGCRIEAPTLPAHLDTDGIEKFLKHSEEKDRSENYLYLLRRNLNWWLPLLEGRDLNDLDEAEVRRLVLHDQNGPAHFQHQKLTAIRAFVRFTRGGEEPKGSRRPLGIAVKKVGTFPAGKGWHMLRHSFASHCVAAGYHLREVQEWMGHSTIQVTERYAHLAPRMGGTDKLADPRLMQYRGTSVAPAATNVVHLAEFQSKNETVARPDLVAGPVFKTGGAYRDVGSVGSIPMRYRHYPRLFRGGPRGAVEDGAPRPSAVTREAKQASRVSNS